MARDMGQAVPGQTQVEQVPAGTAAQWAPATVVVRNRVAWGPIWGGLVTTISTFLVLETLLLAIGWLSTSGISGLTGPTAWWTGAVAVISFFLGGAVATSTSPVRGIGADMLNGFLVWALATGLIVVASILGAGVVFGTVGSLLGHLLTINPSHPLSSVPSSPNVSINVNQAALWAFITLIVTAASAALGGWLGGIGRPMGEISAEEVQR